MIKKYDDYLKHHGIKGQKWGDRNGPPYPLDDEDHSASEEKAGWEDSLDADKYSQERLDSYRAKMIKRYKTFDPATAKLYKNATDEQLKQDIKNRETQKKVMIALAAAVGVAGACYVGYRVYQHKAVAAAVAQNPNLQDLLDSGFDIGVSGSILNVNAHHKLLDDNAVSQITKAVNGDLDVCLKNAKFARADYRQDFNLEKANTLLFAAVGESDAKIYQKILPNRHDPKSNIIKQWLIDLKEDKTITIPNRKKALEILKNMEANNPEFAKEMIESYKHMITTNIKNNPFIFEAQKKQILNMTDAEWKRTFDSMKNFHSNKSVGSGEYGYSTILGGGNKIGDMVVKEFRKQGYDAIVDAHDIIDNVSKMPIILFNDEKLKESANTFLKYKL